MLTPSELDKSLQELEQSDWGDPTYDSHLVTTVHRLRRVPLRQFSVEDLRIMIGQSIGLPYLVPLALQHLPKNPLAERDFYPGDLLKSVLTADQTFGPSTRRGAMKSETLPVAHSHAYTRCDPEMTVTQMLFWRPSPKVGRFSSSVASTNVTLSFSVRTSTNVQAK